MSDSDIEEGGDRAVRRVLASPCGHA